MGIFREKMTELPKGRFFGNSALLFLYVLNLDNNLRQGMRRDILKMALFCLLGNFYFRGGYRFCFKGA
jgi:hypothetical protein